VTLIRARPAGVVTVPRKTSPRWRRATLTRGRADGEEEPADGDLPAPGAWSAGAVDVPAAVVEASVVVVLAAWPSTTIVPFM
jgi:hypothetical protein